jgi:hypothetical protein
MARSSWADSSIDADPWLILKEASMAVSVTMSAFFPVAPAKASSSDNIFSGRLDGQDSSQSAPPLLQSLTSVLIVNMEKRRGKGQGKSEENVGCTRSAP